MKHSPYSPGFPPCDFCVCVYIKDRLGTFQDEKSLRGQLPKSLRTST